MAPRRRIVSDSDEESSGPSKRIRLEDDLENLESSDEETQDDTPLPADADGYVEGSIVKITLRNFVTYDYCEFSPGPQLNMIIGPNGTGKSTIVCAVALGLGGAPSLLGRAKNISEFVKTGEDEAMIQIELKRTGANRNVVIQRNITKSSNASSWRLNGKQAPQKHVMEIVNQLNIQVDNLCQFLPQDKVAEFAQLTPPALLEKTQEAAGATTLLKWHQDLIEWKKDEKAMTRTFDSDQDHLSTLNARNAELEKDVTKMRQHKEALRRIELLKAKLPLVRYTDAKNAYERAKEVEQERLAVLNRLKEENRPIEDTKQNYINAVRVAQRKKQGLDAMNQEQKQKLHRIANEIKSSTQESKILESKITSLERKKEERATDIKNREKKIAYLKGRLGEEPSMEGLQELSAAIDELSERISTMEMDIPGLLDQYSNLQRIRGANERELRAKIQEVNTLQDSAKQRMNALYQWQQDTVSAFDWLKQNRQRFKGKVHGPIVLQIHLKDERYADLVETILGGRNSSLLRTFVCETKEDYKLFTQEMVDAKGYRLSVAWPGDNSHESVDPPMSREELRSTFGMDYFVSELLEGPKILIDYLCQESRINLVPVSLRAVDETRIADSGRFRRFAIHNSIYEVKQYKYGRGGNQVQVRKIWQSIYLKKSLDSEALQRAKGEVTRLQDANKEVSMEMESVNNNRSRIKQKQTELQHEMNDKKAQKRDILLKKTSWEKGQRQIDQEEIELQTIRELPADDTGAIEQIKEQIMVQVSRRATLAERYTNILKDFTKSILQRNVAQLEHMQAEAQRIFVEEFASRQDTAVRQAEQGHRQALSDSNHKKSVAQNYRNEAQRAGRNLDDGLKEEFQAILAQWRTEDGLDQTAAEVEEAIQAEAAKAETLKASNPRAMELYDQRCSEIQQLSAKIDAEKQQLDALREKINNVRSQWEPQLNALVGRISESFGEALKRIGCAGEVGVAKDEDFDKWGIEIRVKFRDNEKLQLLTGQRQSGGERAVSTILYLMSLQNLAKSPFRVVDEINQGMDPRNERMIHEQIVKGASKPGTAQYFLITPKLLPDLYYNERMRVLCIYNGEWQPKRLKPISDYIKRARSSAGAIPAR